MCLRVTEWRAGGAGRCAGKCAGEEGGVRQGEGTRDAGRRRERLSG